LNPLGARNCLFTDQDAEDVESTEVAADFFDVVDGVEEVAVEEVLPPSDSAVSVSRAGVLSSATKRDELLAECESTLGYAFHDRELLANALTHSSSTSDKRLDNERLEFFGDAVLDLVVREYLYHNYPNRQEGDLTEAKSSIVCRTSLVKAAKTLDLKRYIVLGRGIGRRRCVPDSLLADAYEAVVAAVYLDGGYETAKTFIMRSLWDAIPHAIERANAANCKSTLQKILQQSRLPLPVYKVCGSLGPEHSRTFRVMVLVDGRELGTGLGSSKKAAEQEAARAALDRIGDAEATLSDIVDVC
jgi:ribonuclease-3